MEPRGGPQQTRIGRQGVMDEVAPASARVLSQQSANRKGRAQSVEACPCGVELVGTRRISHVEDLAANPAPLPSPGWRPCPKRPR